MAVAALSPGCMSTARRSLHSGARLRLSCGRSMMRHRIAATHAGASDARSSNTNWCASGPVAIAAYRSRSKSNRASMAPIHSAAVDSAELPCAVSAGPADPVNVSRPTPKGLLCASA
eukprot:scaffold6285_cov121-Isochrysis_galbana.AAC.11